MDPSGGDDDECFSVQLDSSDMASNATKVVFSHLAWCLALISFHNLDNPPREVSNEALSYDSRLSDVAKEMK